MRILLISHGIYPLDSVAGVELFTSEVAQFLSAEHEITVLVFKHNRSTQQSIISRQRIGKINVIRVPGSKDQDPNPTFSATHFCSLLKSIEPDLIYILSPYRLPFRLMDEADRLKIPWILHLHDFYLMCPRIRLMHRNGRLCAGPRRWRCTRCLKKLSHPASFFTYAKNFSKRTFYAHYIIRKARAVLCVSHDLARRYAKFGLASKQVIIVSPSWRQQICLKPKGQVKSVLRIGFFGGASSEKGINILANALTYLQCAWHLAIYGIQGDGKARVIRLFKGWEDRITLNGPFVPEMIDTICSNLDVLVVPSIWPETYGRVVDKAIARGVIVIASQIGGMSERLIDGFNGFVFPPGDSVTLAKKITYIFEHIEELRGSINFNFMQQHKDDYAEKLLNICTSIVENRLRSGFLLDHEVDVLRISQVTGKTRDKVEQCLLEELQNPGSNVNAARLAAGPPKDISEIEAFYRSNEAYLYDLVVAHATWERYLWRTTALSILIKLGCKSVLDYGAGIGRDSLFFASAGLKVTYYDMNEYLRRFAEDFANSKQIQLITITNTDVLPNGLFDAVYCTKVLEYVPNPLKELKRMRRLIKRRGYLLATESFGAVGDRFLTHLPFLSVYSGRLPAIAEQVGLSLREIIPIPGNKMFVFEGI